MHSHRHAQRARCPDITTTPHKEASAARSGESAIRSRSLLEEKARKLASNAVHLPPLANGKSKPATACEHSAPALPWGTCRDNRTRDSRFHLHACTAGRYELYCMYSRNLQVEADGLAYHELNVLRAALLEPILYVLMGANVLLYVGTHAGDTLESANRTYHVLAHAIGLVFNLLRLAVGILVFIVEVVAWPFRVVVGVVWTPLGLLLGAGHIYALPCSVIHGVLQGAGTAVVRRVTVKSIVRECRVVSAGGFGQVFCYKTNSLKQAFCLASSFKIQQRCGIGPECIWVRGHLVYVARWMPIAITTITALLGWGGKACWKLMDLTTYFWRITVFDFEDESRVGTRRRHRQAGSADIGSWAVVSSDVDFGEMSNLSDLEELYNSPRGWNKYHRMRADGNQVRVYRPDRRALSHFVAAVSSVWFYVQFRDATQGWLGLSVELSGLLIANYALVTAYAAEVLLGKVSEVVDAKSERYGAIVTRAVDRGYVRGFHVPDGDWLGYENGEPHLPTHEVRSSEVNVTCNSYVYRSAGGLKIKVLSSGDKSTWPDGPDGDFFEQG